VLDDNVEGSRQQEVAHQDACRIAVDARRRRHPAPEKAAIDHVIVQQRSAMHQLGRNGELHATGRSIISKGFFEQQQQTRANPFAARHNQMA
jgi:hypothetical protein